MNRATFETSASTRPPSPHRPSQAVIELFTHRGELVLDPFVGSGTTLVAAQDLERNAVGYDLQPAYVAAAQERLAAAGHDGTRQLALVADARAIRQQLRAESVALVFTSPPYANLLNRRAKNKSRRGDLRRNDQYLKVEQYSQDPRDLGTPVPRPLYREMGAIFAALLPVLRPGGHCVINVPDHVVGESAHHHPPVGDRGTAPGRLRATQYDHLETAQHRQSRRHLRLAEQLHHDGYDVRVPTRLPASTGSYVELQPSPLRHAPESRVVMLVPSRQMGIRSRNGATARPAAS